MFHRPGRWMLLSVAAALAASLTLSADPPEPNNSLAAPAAPAAPPAEEKIQTADQATARLRELLVDLAKADEDKLDFDEAKALYVKLSPIWPLADQLDEKTKPQFLVSYAAASLGAGEPESALAAYKALFECKHLKMENDGFYRRALLAACIAGDSDGAKQMLGKLDLGAAKEMTRVTESFGRKVAPFKVDLAGGRSLFCPTDDRVFVLVSWAAMPNNEQGKFIEAVKAFDAKYRKHDALRVVGINLNPAADRAKVIQYIKAADVGHWLHVLEGRPDGLLARTFGLSTTVGQNTAINQVLIVLGPDNRVLFKGGPADSPAPWAVNAALRQIEKKQAKTKTKTDPAKPPTSRPANSTGPAVTHPAPVATSRPTVAQDKPDQMLKLAQTYRSGGLNDQADEMLRKIVADYPTSPAADQARKLLAGEK